MLEFHITLCVENEEDVVALAGEGCAFAFDKGYFNTLYQQGKVVHSAVGLSISFGAEECVCPDGAFEPRMRFIFKDESLLDKAYRLLCGVETTLTPLEMLIASAEGDFL